MHSLYACNYGYVVRRLHNVHEHQCLCVRVCDSVFVCGLHMLTITSPICVNHHRRRKQSETLRRQPQRHQRERGNLWQGLHCLLSCQTNFTHTSSPQLALHWLSCAPCMYSHIITQALNLSSASRSSPTYYRVHGKTNLRFGQSPIHVMWLLERLPVRGIRLLSRYKCGLSVGATSAKT